MVNTTSNNEERNELDKLLFILLKKILLTGYDFICIKLATVVEGNPKAPFSVATTPRCWGGRYSFPWIVLLYP